MVAQCMTKVNGIWYRAGEEIPATVPVEDKPVKEDTPKYTKTDINRMPTAELRSMAVNTGVEGAEEMTGAQLKEYLIGVLGL